MALGAVTIGSMLTRVVTQLPDLSHLSHAEKDTLIRALWSQVQA